MSPSRSVFRQSRLGIAALSPTQWPGTFRPSRPLATWNSANEIKRSNGPSLRPGITKRYIHITSANESHEPKVNEPTERDSPDRKEPSQRKPICDICRTNPTTEFIPAGTLRNRRLWDPSWTSFCKQCYKNYAEGKALRRQEMAQERASRKRRVAEMLERVRGTEYTERVDLWYANMRLKEAAKAVEFFRKPRRQFQKNILDHLREELDIQRAGRGYTCGKEKVDAMDWRLWCLHPYMDVKV